MTERYALIMNPRARSGKSKRRWVKILELCRESGLNVDVLETAYHGHARELAEKASETHGVVVAAGGDGTVNQVATGIYESRKAASLGILPLGTGNDFVKSVGISRNLRDAVKVLEKRKRKTIDLGKVTYTAPDEVGEHFFLNAIGAGFDAAVAYRSVAFKSLPGISGYLVALLNTLRHRQDRHARITIGPEQHLFFEDRLLLVTLGNGICNGGMFYLTPDALVDDGLLDVTAVDAVSTGRILSLIPRVLRGRLDGVVECHRRRVTEAHVLFDAGVPVHVDGELLTDTATQLSIHILPESLSLIVP